MLHCLHIHYFPHFKFLDVLFASSFIFVLFLFWGGFFGGEVRKFTTYRQLRARRALLQLKDVPLRTRRVLLLYKVNGNRALLVLNWRYGLPLHGPVSQRVWLITSFLNTQFPIELRLISVVRVIVTLGETRV